MITDVISNKWGILFCPPVGTYPLRGVMDDYRQQGGAEVEFKVDDPRVLYVAAHSVYQYRSVSQAGREFQRQLPVRFNNNSVASITLWQVPEQLPYSSTVADQFYFACHESSFNGVRIICKSFGQYNNYLVLFNANIIPEYMTYSDIKAILQAIDDKMLSSTTSDE